MTNAQAELPACTEPYLNESYSSRLRVLCSEQAMIAPTAAFVRPTSGREGWSLAERADQ